METAGNYFGLIAWSFLVVGVVWLIWLNFKISKTLVGKTVWTIVLIFLQPMSGAIFFAVKNVGLTPLILIVAALGLLTFGAFSANSTLGQ
jgi:hypothetical protein